MITQAFVGVSSLIEIYVLVALRANANERTEFLNIYFNIHAFSDYTHALVQEHRYSVKFVF